MNSISMVTLVLFSIFIVTISVIIFVSNRHSNINRSFAITAILSAVWLSSNQLSNSLTQYDTVLFLNKLIFASSALFSTALFYFCMLFPEKKSLTKKASLLIIAPGLIVAALSFTSLVVKDISIKDNISDVIFGPLNIIYAIQFGGFVISSLVLLVIKLFKSTGLNRTQLKLLFWGLGLFILTVSITNFAIPFIFNNFSLTTYGSYFIIFFLGFTTYAILKHHLLDLRVILTEAASVLVIFAILAQTLFSKSLSQGIINCFVLIVVSYGGLLLIRSVKDEIGQRQKIQKIAKRLEEANTHLEELDKIKDDFLSMASHELNTPIAAIEGYLSMILVEKMAGEIPAKVRQYLESVFTSSQRLAHLVKDLLNVSRIEGNRIHIIYEEKPIVDIIKQSIMEIDPKVKEAHHTLTFHEPKKKIPATYLDVTRVTEVLINMLGNSCKYTDPGGKIEINVVSDDQKVVVSVADNGKGIPKERNQAVFEKFSQVDVLKDEVKGTGLGMYISKRFIELMKGKMWFHSDGEGKGTTFYFSLPLLTKKPYDPHDGEGAVLH